VPIVGAVFGDNPSMVILATAPLNPGTAYTLSVSGVRDMAAQPNTLQSTQLVFVAREFNRGTLGSPALPGSLLAVPGGVDVTGSGGDFGDRTDEGEFAYQVVWGDFDFRVRVQAFDAAEVWAKAGLMARESLGVGSRFAAALTTPTLAGSFFEQ